MWHWDYIFWQTYYISAKHIYLKHISKEPFQGLKEK